MSPLPVTRVACKLLALAGIASGLFFLSHCGEEEGRRAHSRRASSSASVKMPNQWDVYTKGLLAELKQKPQFAEELAAVPDSPQALWLYWYKLVGNLQRADLLRHVYMSETITGLHPRIQLQGDEASQQKQALQIDIYLAIRDKLEDAIIQHSKLGADEAKYTKEVLFPALWNSYVRPEKH